MTAVLCLRLFAVLLVLASLSVAVNGCSEVTKWSEWGSCTKLCGGGTSYRSRKCCSTSWYWGHCWAGSISTKWAAQSCNTHCCKVNGGWSGYGLWSSCPVTCGGTSNNQYRSRSCTNPRPSCGGSSCYGSSRQYQTCNGQCCAVNGGWSAYGSWSACPVTCGGSSNNQYRRRSCTNPSRSCGGRYCSGSSTEYRTCNSSPCPVHGGWSGWGSYGSCSKTCGGGTKTKSRSCNSPTPRYGGRTCSGSSSSSTSCNTNACPVNGGWSDWSKYGTCSKICGGGIYYRSRTCDNPSPAHGGTNCAGSGTDNAPCNTQNCPINGAWSGWSKYGLCSVLCGGGTFSRTRACDNPAAAYGGTECEGTNIEHAICNTHNCPIDGVWTNWAPWTECTLTCGGGTQITDRTCTNPEPQHGGADCDGDSHMTQSCNIEVCPDYCKGGPCQNEGSCTNIPYGYKCSCAVGFNGTNCEININDCVGVTCSDHGVCLDLVNDYECQCNDGYKGDHCQSDVNECLSSPCDVNGECTNNVGSFICECNIGYSGNGFTCEDVDECLTKPCDDNGHCTNTDGSFTCECNTGYAGDGFSCIDVNECLSSPCDVNGECTNNVGSFICKCNIGYSGNGFTCEDVDECLTKPCDDNGHCTNTDGNFTCECNMGYAGDGFSCIDVNECLSSPCDVNGECTNNVGSFICKCNIGYSGNGFTCEDVDECLKKPCDENGHCTNTDGSFTCECNTGYSGDGFSCTDIDECLTSPCDVKGECTNNVGSFICECNIGYSGNGFTCEDVDECLKKPCDEDGHCTNTDGSFTCECNNGYAGDGFSCIDVDECLTSPCDDNGKCTNNVGNFTCECNIGYSGNGFTCEDVDECSTTPCDSNGECKNTDGSFFCICNIGYVGNGFTCADIDYCVGVTCYNGGTCQDQLTNYTCICTGDFYGDNCRSLDGGWDTWSEFSECSTTCGTGVQISTRTCSNPAKEHNGRDCEGEASSIKSCDNKDACAVPPDANDSEDDTDVCATEAHGAYLADPYNCSSFIRCVHGASERLKCPDGLHWSTTKKECDHPINASCTPLSVDGGWEEWSDWSKCSVSCGKGTQSATRACTNPVPRNGEACVGKTSRARECKGHLCQAIQCLTVSCDSWQYQRKKCDVSGMTADSLISSVTVLEQKSPSESQCVENKSFGVNTLDIWVDKGCRADFTVCYIPDYDDCGSSPCLNGATCKDEPGNYTCTCANYFKGDNCETAMMCPQPEVVDNGTKSSTGVSPGDSVTYTCDEYYRRVEGDMYRVCQTDETWNGTLPTCELIDCGKPEEGSGADLVSYETTPGKTAEYTCHENKIQKQGNLTRNCLMSGEWDGEKPVCDIADGAFNSAAVLRISWLTMFLAVYIKIAF